jgi:uncharacterized protein involved in type VI secretion and phage assembly
MLFEQDGTELLLDRVHHRHFGKYSGTVDDNQDPTNHGRLKVQVPGVLGDLKLWARPCVPYAGPGVGFYARPDKGAGVWVEFEGGDPGFPIVTGFFWADNELPKDQEGNQAAPPLKILRSAKGLMLALDDDRQTVTISDKDGGNKVIIEVSQGQVTVEGATKVVVDAPLIELVQNATHPLVFGDALLQYLNQLVTLFNTHLHPGELALGVLPVTPAPPVAPFPPADPSLLSTRVTTD